MAGQVEDIMRRISSDMKSIGSYWRAINFEEALLILNEGSTPQPSINDLAYMLLKCKKEKRDRTQVLHLRIYIARNGLEAHRIIGNYLVCVLAELRTIADAEHVFDRLSYRNEWAWNSLITGYVKLAEFDHALEMYRKMQADQNVQPNGHTFVAVLKACGALKDVKTGLKIHKDICRTKLLEMDPFVGRSLFDMYLHCGLLVKAEELFHNLLIRDVVSWTALIAAYTNNGHGEKALQSFDKMQSHGIEPDAVTFICCLKACGSIGAISKGHEIHLQVERMGLLKSNLIVGTALVDMYGKCGLLDKAEDVFEKLPYPGVVSWNALIAGYVKGSQGMEALRCFDKMKLKGVPPDAVTFISVIKACGALGVIDKGHKICSEIERKGFIGRDVVLDTALIDMYAKCGWLEKAQQMFENAPVRNEVSWNALIGGYADHGFGEEALKCVDKMQAEGVYPGSVTFACSLKACSSIGDAIKGQEIHCEIARKDLLREDVIVGNTLIDMYAKCGSLANAWEVFNELPHQNVVSWNAMITAYAEHGMNEEAICFYENMQIQGFKPDIITFICTAKACRCAGAVEQGRELHTEIARRGLVENEPDIGNAVVDMYVYFGFMSLAMQVFDTLSVHLIVSWNAIISGFCECGKSTEALKWFEQMHQEGVCPDAVTFICILKSCGASCMSFKGKSIHAITEVTLKKDHLVGTAVFDMYLKCGMLEEAHQSFSELPGKDAVAWNALISGYAADLDNGEEAFKFYEQMIVEGSMPTVATFISIVKACTNTKSIDTGIEIHTEIARLGFLERDHVGNTLIDMYGKFGLLMKAREVFAELPVQDVVSWTTLIASYVEHGHAAAALKYFDEMQSQMICPNSATFIFSLKACSSVGGIVKAREIHAEIVRLLMLGRDILTSNALVDMYAKCGLLAIAKEVFDTLPRRSLALYNSLMTGYCQFGKIETVFSLYDKMSHEHIKPDAVTFVILLNACSQTSLLEKGHAFYELMGKQYGVDRSIEHYTCMIDLYSRSGQLDKAVEMIEKLPLSPDLVVWNTLLGACKNWGHFGHGRHAFEHALQLYEKSIGLQKDDESIDADESYY